MATAAVADPATTAGQARHLLGEGQLLAARQLIADALKRHPHHAALLELQRVIAPGQVRPQTARYPERRAELVWIARHRERYANKWVTLLGDRVLAIEDDPAMLLLKLRQQRLSETPLVHHLR